MNMHKGLYNIGYERGRNIAADQDLLYVGDPDPYDNRFTINTVKEARLLFCERCYSTDLATREATDIKELADYITTNSFVESTEAWKSFNMGVIDGIDSFITAMAPIDFF